MSDAEHEAALDDSNSTVELQTDESAGAATAQQSWLKAHGSRYFMDWLAEQGVSLAFTTYQTGKLFFVGRKPDSSLSMFERTYNHCMGMWAAPDAKTIWLSSRYQIWQMTQAPANAVPYQPVDPNVPGSALPPWAERGYDAAYIPRLGYTTGHLDVHDMAVDADGRLIFVNTMFGCLATLSETANFQPLWQPKFISALVPEDRCHLNGLAMRDGKAAYVTAVADSDVADGWRDRRRDGGVIVDVQSNEIVARGLSMPHSPRWYRDKLWVLNSGRGELGSVDLDTGKFEPLAFCPGYLRGMTFVGKYAVVSLSKPRHDTFHGLELDERLQQRGAKPQCGLQVIDLETGAVAHWLKLEGQLVTELYDTVVLPGVRQPMSVGFKTNEIERLVLIQEAGQL
jgi:uncharacterized protein (TIGR03032 family)